MERLKPVRGQPYEVALLGSAEKPATLDIHIASVLFEDHPLFCKEDVLASALMVLYKEYLQYRRVRTAGLGCLSRCFVCSPKCLLSQVSRANNARAQLDALLGGSPSSYDFERDRPRELEARALDVLSTISRQVSDAEVRLGRWL